MRTFSRKPNTTERDKSAGSSFKLRRKVARKTPDPVLNPYEKGPEPDSINDIGIQAKLTVSKPGDSYEREADRVADQVTCMQRPYKITHSPITHRCSSIKDKTVKGTTNTSVSTAVHNVVNSPGRLLPESARAYMEPRFGLDFSRVRVHTDSHAAQSAHTLRAAAYTMGSDIVFGRNRYDTASDTGRHLLAHELTHVTQQSGTVSQVAQRSPEDENEPAEAEAIPLVLLNPRFAGDRILKRILNDEIPALSSRHDGRNGPVSKVQRALVALGFELPMHRADGSYGAETEEAIRQFRTYHGPSPGNQLDGATLAVLDGIAPGPGERHEHTVDYDRLLADRRLDVTVGIGASDEKVIRKLGPGRYETTDRPVEELEAERFREWMTTNEFSLELLGLSDNEYWKATKSISWTDSFGIEHTEDIDIWINLIVPAEGAAREFREGLSSDEIAIYSGHARYGSGPDFDAKDKAEENFVIGIDQAMADAGRPTRVDVARSHGVAVDEVNDLVEMVKSGDIDPNRYRVLFLNACTSLAYLDEIRSQIGGTENVDVIATRRPSAFTPLEAKVSVREIQRFLKGLFESESVETIIAGLDEVQRDLHSGRRLPRGGIFSSSGMGDNPRAP